MLLSKNGLGNRNHQTYNYSAAAVKCWGHGTEVLPNRANPPCTPVSVPAPTGPSTTIYNRSVAIRKCNGLLMELVLGIPQLGLIQGLVESEGQAMWDEDDVMLFFWGNSQAAKERNLKKAEEKTRRMEQSRKGVPQVSV